MKISIIIPVYNKDKYLHDTLNSIIAQTFQDYECILIDDGSTDESGKICDNVASRDTRFKVIHIPNGGVSHARNVGLEQAQGKYLTFIDGDDLIHPDYLNNLFTCISTSKADLVISGYKKVWNDRSEQQVIVPVLKGIVPFCDVLSIFASEQKASGIYGCCVSKIFQRNLITDIRFDESLKLAEDFDFYLKLYEKIDTVFFDDKAYYYYLQEADNSSVIMQKDNIDYLAQLRINLHYRDMLCYRGFWNGENRQIVEERLSSYTYFILFHTPIPHYQEKFDALYKLYQAEDFPLIPRNILCKWLFFCLCHNQYTAACLTMQLYCLARRIRR